MNLLCMLGFHDWEILDFCKLDSGPSLWKQKACLRCGKFHDGKAIHYSIMDKCKKKRKIRREKALLIAKNHGVEIEND